jgi:Glycosyltransferase
MDKFSACSDEEKNQLRQKYRIDKDKFIILHVGSINAGRNVESLTKLKRLDNQILIIGAVSLGIDARVYTKLLESGCIVWMQYQKHIEDIYKLSDCYVFPVVSKYDIFGRNKSSSIETPLTVLEAMSCNLPVISTFYGSLPSIFDEGEGLMFIDNPRDAISLLKRIKDRKIPIHTREKVKKLEWKNVIADLEKYYEELVLD